MNIKAALLKRLARTSCKGEFNPGEFRQILIVRPAKIGDTICMLPLIRELKKSLPAAEIDVYAGTDNNFMFRYVPQVRRVYTRYKRRRALSTVIEIFRMRANHYDLVIDTMDIRFGKILSLLLINADWLVANAGFESRYGIDNSDLQLYYRLNSWKRIHTTERLLEYLHLLGISDYDSTMEFPVGDKAMAFAEDFLEPYQHGRLIGLNVDASSRERSIADPELIAICHGISRHDSDIKILLFSTPERRSHMQTLVTDARLDNVIIEHGTRSIFDAAALASQMKVMVSPDTSFIHIASAFDIPTVAIYQNDPDHLIYWGPRSSRHVVIQPQQSDASIRGFSVDETVAAAISLLQENTAAAT
jgi:ADP-heptose:LPS heptosyltransferase